MPSREQRRRMIFDAFLGQETDQPQGGSSRRFERFQGFDSSATSERRTAKAVSNDGFQVLSTGPIQSNPIGGALAPAEGETDYRGKRSLVILKYPGIQGNVLATVSNGNATNPSDSAVGTEGKIRGVAQEIWRGSGKSVNLLSRNEVTLGSPPSAGGLLGGELADDARYNSAPDLWITAEDAGSREANYGSAGSDFDLAQFPNTNMTFETSGGPAFYFNTYQVSGNDPPGNARPNLGSADTNSLFDPTGNQYLAFSTWFTLSDPAEDNAFFMSGAPCQVRVATSSEKILRINVSGSPGSNFNEYPISEEFLIDATPVTGWNHLHIQFEAGQIPRVYVNGNECVPSVTFPAFTGWTTTWPINTLHRICGISQTFPGNAFRNGRFRAAHWCWWKNTLLTPQSLRLLVDDGRDFTAL